MTLLSHPPPDVLDIGEDGALHPVPQRIVIETRHNTDTYPLPDAVGYILAVQLVSADNRPFTFLECPASRSYYRLLANGVIPANIPEARAYLRKVNAKIGKNLWYRFQQSLILYNPPVNSGELLVVTYEHAYLS